MPVRKVIPYLEKPEEITTGTATWYATTYNENGDYCPVLVKTKDVHWSKIEVILNQLFLVEVQRLEYKPLYLTCMTITILLGQCKKRR